MPSATTAYSDEHETRLDTALPQWQFFAARASTCREVICPSLKKKHLKEAFSFIYIYIYVLLSHSNVLCETRATMDEFGVYDVQLSPTGNVTCCSLEKAKKPVDIYARIKPFCCYYTNVLCATNTNYYDIHTSALLACLLFYVVLALLWIAFNIILKTRLLQ